MTKTLVVPLTKTVETMEIGETAYIRANDLLTSELHIWHLNPNTQVLSVPPSAVCVLIERQGEFAYVVRLHGDQAWVYQPRYLDKGSLPKDKTWILPYFEGCSMREPN